MFCAVATVVQREGANIRKPHRFSSGLIALNPLAERGAEWGVKIHGVWCGGWLPRYALKLGSFRTRSTRFEPLNGRHAILFEFAWKFNRNPFCNTHNDYQPPGDDLTPPFHSFKTQKKKHPRGSKRVSWANRRQRRNVRWITFSKFACRR